MSPLRVMVFFLATASLGGCDALDAIYTHIDTPEIRVEAAIKPRVHKRDDYFVVFGRVEVTGTSRALEWVNIECIRLLVGNQSSEKTYMDSLSDLPTQTTNAGHKVLADVYWTFNVQPSFAA